jgi:hypothetical protein
VNILLLLLKPDPVYVSADIANSAQRTPSEPWTVKARFWSKGIVNDGTILGPETFTVLFDSNVISDTDLKDCIGKVGKALCLKAPQKTPFILPDTCRLEGQSTWDDLEKRRQELTDQEKMVAIGRHPQVIYEIWVKLDCLRPDFWARSYRFRKDIETNLLEELEQNPNKAGKTETIITTKSISAARNYPRTAQVDVMGGKSANDVSNTFLGS